MTAFLNILVLVGILSGSATSLAIIPTFLIYSSQKKKALRDYIRRLGRVLRVRYGVQDSYGTTQVIHMMRKWGYSSAYDGYGLALYCSQEDFDAYYSSMAKPYDYAVTREEMNQHLPFTDIYFSAADVIELGDRINAKGRALKRADDNTYDSSDLDKVSGFIRSNKGRDYGDNFEDRSSGGSSGGSIPYGGSFGGFD